MCLNPWWCFFFFAVFITTYTFSERNWYNRANKNVIFLHIAMCSTKNQWVENFWWCSTHYHSFHSLFFACTHVRINKIVRKLLIRENAFAIIKSVSRFGCKMKNMSLCVFRCRSVIALPNKITCFSNMWFVYLVWFFKCNVLPSKHPTQTRK